MQTVEDYFDWVMLLNIRKIAFGPTGDVFTKDNLQKTYGGRLSFLDQDQKGVSPLLDVLLQPNTQWVLLGTMLLGMTSGVLGSFALLRRQSLIGDAMSHAALPGICIAFIIVGSKEMIFLVLGAGITAYFGTFLIQTFVKHSRIKTDTAIGLVLSVFFGIGIVLLTIINRSAGGNQAGLNEFIFGQAAAMVRSDVYIFTGAAILLLATTFLLFKELKLITFDREFAEGLGLPATLINGILMTMITASVVIGLQAVGVVLMAAMLIAPAITARYWTNRLSVMIILSGILGGFSGIIGTLVSTQISGMPTGPLIIVSACLLFFLSLFIAPKKGLITKAIHLYRLKKQTSEAQVMQSLYELHEEEPRAFTSEEIQDARPITPIMFRRTINSLIRRQWITTKHDNSYQLTSSGQKNGYRITLNNRYLQLYSMYELQFAHLPMEKMNWNFLSLPKEDLQPFDELLKEHDMEPLSEKGGGHR
ncbi:manganese ABC transporter, inner membrane permease protein SitC [Geomicrobium sp. JCM 19039]|nr:manganese ABC transporter, inner membrane permease protein SitC [Geomicrobium sp. JCM 19039]